MEMTLAEAATAVGMTKQGLLKAIKDGRLSGEKDAHGVWKVDSSELFRVYQPTTGNAATAGNECEVGYPSVAELMARLEAAADVRRILENRIARAERDLDAANARVDQLLLALPAGLAQHQHQAEAPPKPITPEQQPEPVQALHRGPEKPVVASEPETWIEVPDDLEKPKKRGWLARWFGGGDHDA